METHGASGLLYYVYTLSWSDSLSSMDAPEPSQLVLSIFNVAVALAAPV